MPSFRVFLFATLAMLFASPAFAFNPTSLGPLVKRTLDNGRAQDAITYRSIDLFPKTDHNTPEAGVVNGVRFCSDLLGSWAGQVRTSMEVTRVAYEQAVNQQDAERVLAVAVLSLKGAAALQNVVLGAHEDALKESKETQVVALATDFNKVTAEGQSIVRAIQALTGNPSAPPVNSALMAKGRAIQDRLKHVIKSTLASQKSAKSGLEANLADEIYLHAMYGHDELSMAMETASLSMVFPRQVKDQQKTEQLRGWLVKYAAKLQGDIDAFYNRLQRNVKLLSKYPELQRTNVQLVELNTAMQSFMVDVMHVVSTGQAGPGGQTSRSGPDQAAPVPQAKPNARDKAAAQDRQAFEDKPAAPAKGKEQSKPEAKSGAMKWDPGALPR